MPLPYTFDELDPFTLAWHPKGYLWSPGPGGGAPVYAWPQSDDELGGEPDLERDDVMIRRVDIFPYGGWMHFAECECEDCIGPSMCPACETLHHDRQLYPVATAPDDEHWERRPNDGPEACDQCGAEPGRIHTAGCPEEVCPRCGGRMASCLPGGDGPCRWVRPQDVFIPISTP